MSKVVFVPNYILGQNKSLVPKINLVRTFKQYSENHFEHLSQLVSWNRTFLHWPISAYPSSHMG